jgi:cytochrome c oxidase cbb3-type subunit 4
MLKEVVSRLDYSLFQELAMVLFGLSFLLIGLGTWWLGRETSIRYSSIPLTDEVVDPFHQADADATRVLPTTIHQPQ